MRAFVLSGGGNYGALQVGGLQILLAHGIHPDMVVGVSAGALNAAWFANRPTSEGLLTLEKIWCRHVSRHFTGQNIFAWLLRLVKGQESIFPNEPLVRTVSRWVTGGKTIGEYISPRLYVVATRLSDGELRVFGDFPEDRLVDGLMASTALPPLFPPWKVGEEYYVDGGFVSNLPLQVAVERGADEIYALQIFHPASKERFKTLHGVIDNSVRSIGIMIDQQVKREIAQVQANLRITLHVIRLTPHVDPGFWNFSTAQNLILAGRLCGEEYLSELATSERKPVQGWFQRLVRTWIKQEPGDHHLKESVSHLTDKK